MARKQQVIDGMGRKELPKLTEIAARYAQLRDERMAAGRKEKEALMALDLAVNEAEKKGQLTIDKDAIAKGEIVKVYSYDGDDGRMRSIWRGSKKVMKVRLEGSDPNDEDEE
jgi:hypothetical protein